MKKNVKKSILLLASLALVMIAVVGLTIAFLKDNTGPVKNTFTPSEVPIKIVEDFDGTAKSNVKIENEKTDKAVNAYIRAMVVINWVEEQPDGTYKVLPEMPEGCTQTVVDKFAAWKTFNNDGFYYWPAIVAPGETTGILIDSATFTTPDEKYSLQIDIIAQAIQAEGKSSSGLTPMEEAWGVKPSQLG